MKDDCILRYSVFIRYLPPQAEDPKAVPGYRRAMMWAERMWTRLIAAVRPASREEIDEAYLAQAASHADLERRMFEIRQQSRRNPARWPL